MNKLVLGVFLFLGCSALSVGTASAVFQPCTPDIIGDYWVNGVHCLDAVQGNCSTTHKCFNSDGSLYYQCTYGVSC